MSGRLKISSVAEKLSRTLGFDGSLSTLRFMSREREKAFSHLGIDSIRDLLTYLPFRYIDLSSVTPVARISLGETATISGVVDKVVLKRPRPRLPLVEVYVEDATGIICLTFFRQPWLAQQMKKGTPVVATGKVSMRSGFKHIVSPFYEIGEKEKSIYPVYRTTAGLSMGWFRRIVSGAVVLFADRLDFLPGALIAKHALMSEGNALREAHFPTSLIQAEQARRRLAYDELLCLQLALHLRQEVVAPVKGFAHTTHKEKHAALLEALPFSLTPSQEKAVEDILEAMGRPQAMKRLLLGDVGTGKTMVAAFALAACADSGSQAAVMAPTSVLALQYAQKLGPLFDACGIRWATLTSATPSAERDAVCRRIAQGDLDVVFGTTALLADDIEFYNLSLVIIDEQHRFGVNQRALLKAKGHAPDTLSMSATPIPRTLALSVYGDLEVTSLVGRPHKGAGVTTKILSRENIDIAYKEIQEAVAAGHQAYIVCPLIDPFEEAADDMQTDAFNRLPREDAPSKSSEKAQKGARPKTTSRYASLAAATTVYKRAKTQLFPRARVGLLTGRMTAEEKDAVMGAFYQGDLDILVSTTVIEVGVDVPRATCMLIMNAECFGLATLHQLRGRVGRGAVSGKVFLHTAAPPDSDARARLALLEKTDDGSELAELDLTLRHEGDLLGYRQSGHATLRLVDLARDGALIEAAYQDARDLLASSSFWKTPAGRCLMYEVKQRYHAYFQSETIH